MKTLIFVLLSFGSFAQSYEYAQIFQSQHDVTRTKASFYFGLKYDSTKQYGQFSSFVDAIDFADKKHWEVITISSSFIDTTNPGIGQTTVIYLRRKKPLTH